MEIIKEKNKYSLYEGNDLLSSIEFKEYDYLELIHIYNVNTNIKYRNRGYATKLLNELYKCSIYGLYLFVEKYNFEAINLYNKLDFKFIKEYKIEDIVYYIMAKGNYNVNKLNNLNFK